jgi:NAD(P)-dependent dehydrogenase (short-subunit alcohol dehydrogenase family)
VQAESRYSRQIALFGKTGQASIELAQVAILGLGGLGSHVAQQLAYLGARRVVLVDPDLVSTSNLNRLISALPADAAEGRPKVDVAARAFEAILPGSQVDVFPVRVTESEAVAAVSACTSAIACLDDDSARLDVIEICAASQVPFFDLATDTGEDNDDPWYGGRILFSGQGERCPVCMDLLNQQALQRAAMDEHQLETDARIYGLRRDSLEGTGPSVVSLNGAVASLAVMEWMVWTTGLRAPRPLLEYRGSTGVVMASSDSPRPGCYYCALWHTPPTASQRRETRPTS